jgi:hypothetical protein
MKKLPKNEKNEEKNILKKEIPKKNLVGES